MNMGLGERGWGERLGRTARESGWGERLGREPGSREGSDEPY